MTIAEAITILGRLSTDNVYGEAAKTLIFEAGKFQGDKASPGSLWTLEDGSKAELLHRDPKMSESRRNLFLVVESAPPAPDRRYYLAFNDKGESFHSNQKIAGPWLGNNPT